MRPRERCISFFQRRNRRYAQVLTELKGFAPTQSFVGGGVGVRDLVPFLMFCGDQHGKAEEAIIWYCSIFPDSRILQLDRYGPDEDQPEGTVRLASFELGRKPVMAIDSAGPHQFTFTPAISMWVECSSSAEIERLSAALSDGGSALMPLGNYGFSKQFCWVADRYGVTWQVNLAN